MCINRETGCGGGEEKSEHGVIRTDVPHAVEQAAKRNGVAHEMMYGPCHDGYLQPYILNLMARNN
jgi:hypothetical protein